MVHQWLDCRLNSVAVGSVPDNSFLIGCCDLAAARIGKDCSDRRRSGVGLYLESKKGNPVAEVTELEVFEYRQSYTSVCWCRADCFDRCNQRINRLLFVPWIEAKRATDLEIAGGSTDQFPVGPDPFHLAHWPGRECDYQIYGITLTSGLAFHPRACAVLLEIGRPDDAPRNPHGAVDSRDRASVARPLHLQVAQMRPLPRPE